MVGPEYISLVENKTKVMGNIELANQIAKIVRFYISHGKDLYETQSKIKTALVNKFGIDWYEKSGEAINFIIENEFAHKERENLPFFDNRQYEANMKNGVMY